MADNKKINLEEAEAIENAIVAEITKNDDIVEYIQPSSLELLKARYAAAEEDESIRNEGFELAKKGGLIKKSRPESTAFDYFSAPVDPKDEIRTDLDSPLSRVFDSTKSEFDADTASFGDINIETSAEKEIQQEVNEAPPEESAVNSDNISTSNNRYGYNTHTRVIYVDENADDGIKKNSDDELSSAFTAENKTAKRRFSPWSQKKK